MKTMNELKDGDCVMVVKTRFGKTKKINGSYDSKLECFFGIWSYEDKVVGYEQ